MQRYLLLFSASAFSSAWWPALPDITALLGVLLVVTACALVFRNTRLSGGLQTLMALVAGGAWAGVWGWCLLAHALPMALDKSDYRVRGEITGLPERGERSTRFEFDVHGLETLSPKASRDQAPPLKRLRLSWYGAPPLEVGQRWELSVRLRAPMGFANPGGFDYRLWLLREGVSATGYVRNGNQAELLGKPPGYGISRYRERLGQLISTADFNQAADAVGNLSPRALLTALAIGDSRDLSRQAWATLRQTGTIHLMIISGLHLGMAALFGMALGTLLGRGLAALGSPFPARQTGAVLALLLALIYGAMAGFTLPTQRATVMVGVFLLAMLIKRALRPWLAFSWALAIQALIDPLAILSTGFWLSYGVVAAFIAYFSGYPPFGAMARPGSGNVQGQEHGLSARRVWLRTRVVRRVVELLRAQWVVFLTLSGALIYFHGEVSLLAPLINLVAIPWFSLGVVPLILLGVLATVFSETLAVFFWQGAAWQLEVFAALLNKIQPYAEQWQWRMVTDQPLLIGLMVLSAGCLLLAPRGLGVRVFAPLLMIALMFNQRPQGPLLEVAVLDVGQGLSVVVSSRDKVLVYDVGAKFSERFDIGSAVLAPYLRYRGIDRVDTLIISHGDIDHAGGLEGLLDSVTVDQILAGQPEQLPVTGARQCQAGMNWQWRDLEFAILHPPIGAAEKMAKQSDNNFSCVLAIDLAGIKILLVGDIEAEVESRLLRSGVLPAGVSLLLAPHHGSQTSSSPEFVRRVSPEYVVYSAGFNHHFGHPHGRIVERYSTHGATQWSTATSGALIFVWQDLQSVGIVHTRDELRGYWHAPIRSPL